MNKKEKLLETSIRLFVLQGFENTPTIQITEESGVASGTLFYHYKTKEDLINAAYMHIKQDLVEEMNRYYNEHDDFKTKLKSFWIGYTKWALKKRNYNLFLTIFLNSKYISEESQKEAESMLKRYNDAYVCEMENNTLKDLSYELFGKILFSLHQIFIAEYSKREKVDDIEIEESFDVVWGAIKRN